ncbi:ABC transporter permease [Oryzobacter terrae]|uniref:ABC transporter permease n=1 Tax=Oryzobacter terrae TaxID=1620385 RepID=UPI003672BD53
MSNSTVPTASAPATSASRRSLSLRATGSVVIGLITAAFALVSLFVVPNFGTTSNIRALLLSVSLTGIAAVGLSLITISGQIFSLAISSMIAIGTIAFARALDVSGWAGLAFAIAVGLLIGATQGLVIGRLRTNPIITTIAFSAILLGVGQLYTQGHTITGGADASLFNSNLFGFLPFQVLTFVLVTVALYLWHRYTVTGRQITLIGLNERAAQISGTRVWPLVLTAFAVSGACTGLAAGLLAAQSGQGNLLLGGAFGFDVIVAVVVGGIAVNGGAGTPLSAAVGALFVGLLGNVLALSGLSYENQLVIKGVLVLLAVTLTGLSSMLSAGGRR